MRTILARIKKQLLLKYFQLKDAVLNTDFYWRYLMTSNGYHISDYTFDENQIAFVHLPKTGGTSFRKMLHLQNDHTFVNVNIHRPISNNCAVEQFKYVTILRDPVDRVWSYYQMVLRNPKGYPYQRFANEGLECFLKKCWAANNMSCQYYTGLVYQKVDESIFNKAVANVSQFYSVLFFENFNEEARLFFEKHNITVSSVPHERKVSYSLPSPQEKELIELYNQFDIQLYHHFMKNKEILCPA